MDLTFEVSNQKVDTIKESFIRFIRRDNPGKIKIHALKDVSFKIYKGEKVGIIGYNGAVLGYSKKFLESKVDEIIEFSELGEFIDIPIKNYSSGMLAKLGFSIATTVNPDILIIDEVLGVGDVNFRKKSSDKIRSLMDGGTTVLLVSHSIPQIRDICDKAIWINNGYVQEIGEVNEVCDHYLKDAEKASKEQLADIEFR